MKGGGTQEEIGEAIRRITELGDRPHVIRDEIRTVIGCVGDERGKARLQSLEMLPGVESVIPILQPFKLTSREVKPTKTVVRVGALAIEGGAGLRHARALFGEERGADPGRRRPGGGGHGPAGGRAR